MTMLTRRSLGGLVLGMLAPFRAADANGTLPLPAGKPILTVSGHVAHPNFGELAMLDRPTLESLGQDGFETATPWYTGRVRFDGIPMTRLLQAVGGSGVVVRVTALNDYTTEIPVGDFERFGVLLATKRNGEYMPVRDKGPFFIIYPFDRFPELQTNQYYTRAAWQVASIAIS